MDNNSQNNNQNQAGGLLDKAKQAVQGGKDELGQKAEEMKDKAGDLKDKLTGSDHDAN